MSNPKASRTRLPLSKKIEIIDLIEKGKERKEVCHTYGLALSSLGQLLKDKLKI